MPQAISTSPTKWQISRRKKTANREDARNSLFNPFTPTKSIMIIDLSINFSLQTSGQTRRVREGNREKRNIEKNRPLNGRSNFDGGNTAAGWETRIT